jgi:hypothetical protein
MLTGGLAKAKEGQNKDNDGVGVAQFLSGPKSGRHEGLADGQQVISRSSDRNPAFRPGRHPFLMDPPHNRMQGVCGRKPHNAGRPSAPPRDCEKQSRHWTAKDFRGHQFDR